MNQSTATEKLLKQYWGYDQFRDPQKEVIDSVINGVDTLAVLPTGAGKSICFQVPALALGGITLVITPLIALMSDQVMQLKKRGINAFALHSGIAKDAQVTILHQLMAMPYGLLYLSPEKLHSQWFQEKLPSLNITLLAVDEAHCISQWGYDFRPEYLKIRESVEKVICRKIALTASATPTVQKDIVEQLGFDKPKVFCTSTYRKNLNYQVLASDDKDATFSRILQQLKGSSIIYVRSRKMCHEMAVLCKKLEISCQIYHAGLSRDQRNHAQKSWLEDEVQLMISTNAFGMGIDKPNVRNVVHYGAPNALEAYYQEAGRAGRDGKEADVMLIIGSKDQSIAKLQIEKVYQPIEHVRSVFQALCNILQLAEGYFLHGFQILDIEGIKKRTQLEFADIHYSLKLLDLSQIIAYEEDFYSPSKLLVQVAADELFTLYQTNPTFEKILKSIIRLYGASVYEEEQTINEANIARMSELSTQKVVEVLTFLRKNRVLRYFKGTDQPVIQFLMPRPSVKSLPMDTNLIKFLKERAEKQIEEMYAFAHTKTCKQQYIASYFGNNLEVRCGTCSSCRSVDLSFANEIISKLGEYERLDLDQIKDLFPKADIVHLAKILEFLVINKKITRNDLGFFILS